jgi:hypothetical protein
VPSDIRRRRERSREIFPARVLSLNKKLLLSFRIFIKLSLTILKNKLLAVAGLTGKIAVTHLEPEWVLVNIFQFVFFSFKLRN